MLIPLYLIVLLSILALFPCFAIGMVLLMKIQAIKGESMLVTDKVRRLDEEIVALKALILGNDNKVADVLGRLQAADVRAISTEETIRALANKWNSREREIAKRDKVFAGKGERDEDENLPPVLDLSSQIPFPAPNQVPPLPRKRRFGEN